MNETTKTLTFVGVAVVVLTGAIASRPRPLENDQSGGEGELLCPELTDPKVARSLEIIDYDEAKSEPRIFKVVQEKGVWRIPSHENYPADAEKQLGEAAASVFDLRKGPLISTDASLHEAFGVVLPDLEKLSPGATGVGKRVVFADKDGKTLADFIIGKAVADRPELHYVRLPDKDAVYQVAVKTEKLSTRFDDWIEKDLLKINSLDIKQVAIEDYTVDEAAGAIKYRGRIGLEYDSKQFKWNLARLETISDGESSAEPLADDEELNSTKLNEMKQALDDLKIVDVHRKPKGLSADLKTSDEFQVSDNESVRSLIRRGFFPARDPRNPDGGITLYANEGDIRTSTTNGVEYVLRFGNIAGKGEQEEGNKEDEAETEKAEVGENRFVMITAEFNEALIPLPELTPLDEETPSKQDGPEPAAEGAAEEGGKEPSADEPAGDAKGDPAADTEGDDEASLDEALEAAAQELDDEEAGKEDAGTDEAENKDPKDEPAADSTGDETKAEEPTTPTKKPEPAGPKAGDKAKLSTKEKVERDRIEKENKRKQDEYDKKIEDGRKLVKQLNSRFADWYYIVSDATYKKIHLGRDDVIKKKDKPADSNKDGKQDGHDHDTDDPGADLNLQKLKDLPE